MAIAERTSLQAECDDRACVITIDSLPYEDQDYARFIISGIKGIDLIFVLPEDCCNFDAITILLNWADKRQKTTGNKIAVVTTWKRLLEKLHCMAFDMLFPVTSSLKDAYNKLAVSE